MAKFGREAAAEDLERVSKFKSAILTSAKAAKVSAPVMAGIVSRETRGLPKYFIGDGGHGHGPCQIDDRSFPGICKAYREGKKTNEDMIAFGAEVLRRKAMYLRLIPNIPHELIERAAIAAYNCGEGNVKRALIAGADVDRATALNNYSADVLERAAFFKENGFGD